ncbi:MAG: response regulator [Sphingomonas bacterium]|nr:response regulator [Sphingomonas bacterium]
MHALIIEDESLIAFSIEGVLRDYGFQSFDVAASAQAAIDAAARRRPDLITSDVRLRPGCGITAVELICERPSIPVVFITGNPADVTRRLPNHHVLSKPFCETSLISAVASAMLEVGEAK